MWDVLVSGSVGFLASGILLAVSEAIFNCLTPSRAVRFPYVFRLVRVVSQLSSTAFYVLGIFAAALAGAWLGDRLMADQQGFTKMFAGVGSVAGLLLLPFARNFIAMMAQIVAPVLVDTPGSKPSGVRGRDFPTFVAMRYYMLILNRTYTVFLTPSMLCAAKVAGLVASPMSTSKEMSDPQYWSRTPWARIYDDIDVTSKSFLRLDSSNFQTPWSQIVKVTYDPTAKWGMGNVPHSGKLYLHRKWRWPMELILLGEQNGEALKMEVERRLTVGKKL